MNFVPNLPKTVTSLTVTSVTDSCWPWKLCLLKLMLTTWFVRVCNVEAWFFDNHAALLFTLELIHPGNWLLSFTRKIKRVF